MCGCVGVGVGVDLCMRTASHSQSHVWRSENNFEKLVLPGHVVNAFREADESLSSRRAWFTQQVPGEPGQQIVKR